MMTRGAVFRAVGEPLHVEDIELLPPRAGEVLVRYVASGLCHSDLHVMDGSMANPAPAVLGHEGAGIVERVGEGVSRVRVGDHVLTSYQPSCGRCRYCVIGRPNLCDLRTAPRHVMPDGTSRLRSRDGGEIFHFLQVSSHAEHAVLPEECLVPIRKDAPLDVVCLISCGVATGVGAVINRARVTTGSTVVVIGCGGVGLNAVQAACLAGAAKVVAVDTLAHKLAAAAEFGATHTVDASGPDVVAEIHAICGGDGADYCIEAVGLPTTIEMALDCVHRGGTAVIAGVAPDNTRISVDPRVLLQEKVLTGTSFGSSRQRVDLPMLVDLFMDGRLKLTELVSRQVDLAGVDDAYQRMRSGNVRRDVLLFG